jgi:hypothetical protein
MFLRTGQKVHYRNPAGRLTPGRVKAVVVAETGMEFHIVLDNGGRTVLTIPATLAPPATLQAMAPAQATHSPSETR